MKRAKSTGSTSPNTGSALIIDPGVSREKWEPGFTFRDATKLRINQFGGAGDFSPLSPSASPNDVPPAKNIALKGSEPAAPAPFFVWRGVAAYGSESGRQLS